MEEDISAVGAPNSEAAPGPGDAEPPATGEPRVDQALRKLAGLAEQPTPEHPGVFEQVHGQLVDVLGELRPGTTEGRTAAVDPQRD